MEEDYSAKRGLFRKKMMFAEPIEHTKVTIEESGIAEIDVEKLGQGHGVNLLGAAGRVREPYLVFGGETMDEPDTFGIVIGPDENLAPVDGMEGFLILSLKEGLFGR